MTFILIMSSVTMVLAVEAGHRHAKKQVVGWMLATIVGGLMFLGCQAAEWTHLHHEGYWWGRFPEIYTGIDQVGALQFANLFVVINIIVLLMTLNGVFERRGSYLMIEKVGLYWHFVDLVWVFVFTFFYLV
jgi:cytochrome c oxidase subunit 3